MHDEDEWQTRRTIGNGAPLPVGPASRLLKALDAARAEAENYRASVGNLAAECLRRQDRLAAREALLRECVSDWIKHPGHRDGRCQGGTRTCVCGLTDLLQRIEAELKDK